MPRKPSACFGCPAYGFSTDWVPDEVKSGAEIYLLNQNPGEDEEAQGQPMIGKTGQAWERTFLRDAGLSREQINVGNAIRCRWSGSNELPPIASILVKEAITFCQAAHFRVPPGTKLLVAAGDYASLALTGKSIADGDKAGSGWRGYLQPYRPLKYAPGASQEPTEPADYWLPGPQDLPVLSMWHIARTFHQPWWILPTKRDWAKVPRFLAGTWPIKPPEFTNQPPSPWPSMFTFDTEFEHPWPKGSLPPLHRYSMCWRPEDGQTAVVEASDHQWPKIEGRPRVVTQYSPADVQHLDNLTSPGIRFSLRRIWRDFLIEDSVWKHAVLWSDHQHDLNYLGSVYSPFNRWKHLGESNPTLYAGLDATGLYYVDRALEAELDADPQSRRVWEFIDRPALGEFVRAQYAGLRTDSDRVDAAIAQLEHEVVEAERKAQALVGWPINLGSNPQVAHQLYKREGLRAS